MAGLWGSAYSASNVATNESYPIIEFTSDGGTPRFRGYESGTETWADMGLPGGFAYDTWVTLKIELLPSKQYTYTVVTTSGNLTLNTVSHQTTTEYIGNTILQGHNTAAGVDYDIYWDNLGVAASSGFVTNTNTGELFCSIQAAIDDNETLAGHTIKVPAGIYTENITVSKGIILSGAKSGIDPRPFASSARVAGGADESIIEGPKNSNVVNITTGNVTIDGFHFRHNGGTSTADVVTSPATPTQSGLSFINNIITDATDEGIQIRGFSNATIQKNYILNSVGDGVNFADNITSTSLKILDNEIENSGSEHGAIFLYLVNDVLIERNIIKNPLRGGIRLGRSSADSHVTNITVKNNEITGVFASSSGSEWGIGVHGAASGIIYTDNITIENNRIIQTGGVPATNFVPFNSYGNVTDLVFRNNYLETTGTKYMRFGNSSGDVSPVQQINATCNWFGSAVVGDVLARVTNLGIHKVIPYLSTSGDSDAGLVGFIPSGACLGPVRNVEQDTYFLTIQAAIDDAATVATNHIEVSAGTYSETVTVNKSLFIQGANKTTPGQSPRGPESIVDGNNGARSGFIITASNVVIDGFKVQNCGAGIGESGIYTNSTGTQIINNVLFNNAKGVYASNTGPATVQNNLFDGNNRPGPAGAVAIYSFTSNALSITNNEFKNQNANSVALFDGGASHQNLVFNNNYLHDNFSGASAVYAAKITGGEFVGNTITNGNRGIKIAGGDTGINIHNNAISGTVEADILVDNADFGANSGIQIHSNSLTGTLAIKNTDATIVDASCNWYGSDVPATVATKVSGTVSYLPFTNSGSDASGDPGFQPGANTCIYLIHNISTSEDFGTIQQAIDDANTVDGNIIKIDAGTFIQNFTVTKTLTFKGANATKCGTDGTRVAETKLIAPTSGVMISLSGSVSATFEGFLIDGQFVANVAAANQNLTIKNSVFELDFTPASNNLYFASGTLSLDCNYVKAISGSNDGSSTHIFFAGAALSATNNKFTSEAARAFMNISGTTSLPVWLNITANASNANVHHNEFFKIDLGILLAQNAGNVTIENNEFKEALREELPGGVGQGAGIAIFENLTPAAPIFIRYNKFLNGEAGIRTSGNGTTFPPANLLTISYNTFEGLSDRAIRVGTTYSSATNKLNALCNWFGAATGPMIAINPGAGGMRILDPSNKVSFRNWLMYGTDTDPGQLGLQLPTSISVTPGNNTSVAENHYRILSNAIGCAMTGQTVTLDGTFDYTNTIAKGEWVKGNDGESQGATAAFYAGSGDDYSILAPARTENVTITSASLGSATIEGPGEIASTALESFLFFNSNTVTSSFKGWTISNLKINNFDASIGADHNGGLIAVMENFKILNNEFLIPADLNKLREADNFQNIGIHMNYGKNQEVKDNKFVVVGTGVSDGTTSYSTTVVLQSATSGGEAYDGLKIQNNQIHITGVPNGSNPARIIGIWENSNNQSGAIDISGNTFVNDDAGNLPQNNKQLAFRVTSFSGDATHQVVYQNNEITGFNRAIDWIGDPFSSYTPNAYNTGTNPVIVQNNKIANVMYGVTVRKKNPSTNSGSPAIINQNSFTGIVSGGFAIVNEGTGETDAECNWYNNPIAANVISSTGGGSVKFIKKLNSGTDDQLGTVGFQTSADCVLPVFNFSTNKYYATIQSAINADETVDGNEIRVSTGLYPENVVVNKGVAIIGADSANVIVDKGPANFGASGGVGFSLEKDGITLSKMKIQNFEHGIATGTATTGVTIDQMNVNKNYSNGFFGKRSATNLTITNSNFNSNGIAPGGARTLSYMRGFMFESQADAVITDLKITNNSFKSNGLVGIDISGLIPTQGILINDNDVWNNFDSQIGVSLELNSLTLGATSINNNNIKLSGTARYGIEVKNPLGNGSSSGNGSIVVSANTIAVVNHTGRAGDLAAIAVMRRKGGYATINDQPQGVRVINNIINDFQNTGDAFGIVLGGTGHLVSGNTISNTKISIQLQKGNTNFNTNNNSPDAIDNYFERDNSGDVCVELGANTIDGGSGAPRLVTGPSSASATLPPVRVTNTNLSARFCTIQQAINFTATTTGHVLDAIASDYPENVVVNKSVVLQGPNKLVAGSAGRGAEASIIPPSDDIANGVLVKVEANDVTIKGFAIDGANSTLASTILINGSKTQAAFGFKVLGQFTGLKIENNIVRNISKHGIELDAANGSTQGNSITGNWFDNIPRYHGDGYYGRGVLLANNFYASVLNNKFTRVERGVQTNNFSKAILSGTWEIKGNDITAYNIGAFINLHYQATTDLSFENNTIDKDVTTRTITSGTLDPLPDTDFTGVEVFSIADAVKVALKGGVIKNAVSGIYSWNNSSSNHLTVDGVAFNTNSVAVLQSNFSRYTGAADSEIDIKNVTVVDGNAVKAFVAEDHASGSGAISSINLVSGNVITSGGGFTHPFHLQGGTKARIMAGGSTVTPSTQDVFTFNVTGTSSTANVVIKAGLTVNLAGSTKRVVSLPAGLIMQMDGDFTAPNKVTDNPVLINGSLWFNTGILNSGNGSIEFGSTASDIMTGSNPEKATSYILGKALLLSRAVGGDAIDMLGVKMLEGPSVGNLVITRTTKTSGSITPAFPADASIRTVWEITPSITSASRGDVQFRYLNLASNINSQNPASIYAYRYNTGPSQWEKKSALRSSAAVADVFTTQPFGVAEFSSWTLSSTEPGPDLRPLIVMSDVGFIKPSALSKNATLRLYNVGGVGTTATGLITVYIYPPNDKFTIALGASADWSLAYNSGGNYYTLTSINTTINYGAAEYKIVNLTVTATSSVSKGKYGIQFEVDGGSGGETNNLNNTVGVEIGVSGI